MRQNIHPSAHAPAREDQCRSCEADHGNDLHSSVREEEKENCNEGRDRNRRRENDEYMGLRVVGRGGMGTVLLGAAAAGNSIKHDAGVVAIKAILKKDGANPNGVHTEKEVLAMVRGHPFLPRLHAHFESERYAFLVMDYCSGGDLNALRQRQADRRLSETAIRFYAAELVLALEHLHGLGIVYRDLKPENVLISDTGHVVLTDFDLSLRLSSIHDDAEQDTCSSCTSKHLDTNLAPDDHQQAQDVMIGRTNPTMRRPNYCLVSCFATGSVVAPEAEEEAAVEFQRRNSKLCREKNVPTAAIISDQQRLGVEALREEKADIAGMRQRSCGIKACRLMARKLCRNKERKIISGKQLISPWKDSAAEAAPAGRRRRRCRHFVGTEEYVAPEVIKGEQYSYAVDWWALGVLLYEMMSGRTPFKGRDRKSTFDNILEQEVAMPGRPEACDGPLRDLLKRLLVKDSMQRLAGAERVKEHVFFQGVQWEQLQHIARPPFLPQSASGLLETGCPFVDVESLLLRAANKAS